MKKEVGYVYGWFMLFLCFILYSIGFGILAYIIGFGLALIIKSTSVILVTTTIIDFVAISLISYFAMKRFATGYSVPNYNKLIIALVISNVILNFAVLGTDIFTSGSLELTTVVTTWILLYIGMTYALKNSNLALKTS
jgi:hypothetical protein